MSFGHLPILYSSKAASFSKFSLLSGWINIAAGMVLSLLIAVLSQNQNQNCLLVKRPRTINSPGPVFREVST